MIRTSMSCAARCLLLLIAAVPLRTASAVPPRNDQCSSAVTIPAAGPFPLLTATIPDITDATSIGDPPLPSCQTNVSRSIWFKFTPSASAQYTISTCANAPTATTVDDTVLAIYTSVGGCAGPFTEIATSGLSDGCDDDSCIAEALQSVISTLLNVGTTYYIVVYQFDTPAPTAGNTAVQLRLTFVAPPPNDTCAGAIALPLNKPVQGTTEVAANDYQLSGAACFTGVGQTSTIAPGGDVVYSFTAPSAGNYSFRVTSAGVGNPVLYAASTCPGATPGTPVTVATCVAASNRNTLTNPAAEELVTVPMGAGQQVFLFVDELALSVGGPFRIEATQAVQEAEPNNTPATAGVIVQGIEGAISPLGDVDFFSLGTPAAGSRLFAMIDGLAGNSTDFDLRITTATDTLEYDDLNCDVPFGSLSPCVAGVPLTGVATFARVSHFSATTAAEPYHLYGVIRPSSASAVAESEPNNLPAQANANASNYFSGVLSGAAPSTDVDMYAVCARAGDLLFVGLDADPLRDNTPINAALALLDASGNVLVTVNDSGTTASTTSGAGSLTSATPNTVAESLVYRVTSSGTYYVRVMIGTTSTGGVGAGDYLLSITGNSACCPADLNGSGFIDVNDLLAVITSWGACAGCPPTHCAADIAPIMGGVSVGNCQIDVNDLLAVITGWGACP